MYPVVDGFDHVDVALTLRLRAGQDVTGVLWNQWIASCHYAEQPVLMQDDDDDDVVGGDVVFCNKDNGDIIDTNISGDDRASIVICCK